MSRATAAGVGALSFAVVYFSAGRVLTGGVLNPASLFAGGNATATSVVLLALGAATSSFAYVAARRFAGTRK